MAGDNVSALSCQQKAARALARTRRGVSQAAPRGFCSPPFPVKTLTRLLRWDMTAALEHSPTTRLAHGLGQKHQAVAQDLSQAP